MKYFIHFLALSFNSIFLTEAAQYECSYSRTAHNATDKTVLTSESLAGVLSAAVVTVDGGP